jgi:ketosteroid isomerase-like protein
MASDRGSRGNSPITPVTAMGIEHVRLSYLYLDRGDIDGYLSLLHADFSLLMPGESEIHGRDRVGAFQAQPAQLAADHLIHHVIGSGDRVAVEGRYVSGEGGEGVDFTEVFSLSEEGLLRSRKRYYFIAPR